MVEFISFIKGPAKVPPNQPKDYLKKQSRPQPAFQSSPPSKTIFEQKKPSVPLHDERPQMAKKTSRNFVTTNAIENIRAIPKKPVPKYVDSPWGTAHNLEGSGLVPQYIHKREYGKTPEYLEQMRKEMEEAQMEYERLEQSRLKQ